MNLTREWKGYSSLENTTFYGKSTVTEKKIVPLHVDQIVARRGIVWWGVLILRILGEYVVVFGCC